MALKIKDRVKGGDGQRTSLDTLDPKELAMGLRVELEHSDDPEVALDIARDHLSVYPNYYTRLKKAKLADELEESLRKKRLGTQSSDDNFPLIRTTDPDLKEILLKLKSGTTTPERANEERKNLIKNKAKAILKAAIVEFIEDVSKNL